MKFKEALEGKPKCEHAIAVVLEHKRPFRFMDSRSGRGREVDKSQGHGAPNLDSKATIVCRAKPFVKNPKLCYVVNGSSCPEGRNK